MSFLLDTNVLSEACKPQGDPSVKAWIEGSSGSDLYLSVLVVGEIRQGIERLLRRDPGQARVFDAWLRRLQEQYRDRVLDVTAAVAEEWGRLNVPDPLPPVDALLAATAKVHGLTLVTRNTEGVARSGVALLNPFLPNP
ncbi:MAG: PIN domain-containing protein [Nitriliruptorales bacterium]|nr:PIN domain-containing protein [Nitriliruptorales bacterium]